MDSLTMNKSASAELNEMLRLRYEPVAVKLVADKAEIPDDALYPLRDFGKHMALCQAFAMARRDRKTVYTDKMTEWCWNPLIGFGLVECPEGSQPFEIVCKNLGISDVEKAREFFAKFPTLEYGKYEGILSAPLGECAAAPDVVLIYCNNAQLRSMLWAIKGITGKIVSTEMDAIDSCVYSCVVPIKTGEYRVTLPDIGEYERAGAGEDEVILSVPGHRLGELLDGLRPFYERGMCYTQLSKEMQLEFSRPPFYNELFESWGLDKGDDWSR